MTDYTHLAGHRFPGGRYTLPAYESWLWTDAVAGTPDPLAAHPEIAYMIGLHGGGASIADIMALLGADEDSGVMFGELQFAFDGVLRPGAAYDVAGEVVSVERKEGRRAGVFDRATFVHRIAEAGACAPVATVTHVWIFPRKDEA
ncbi:MAG TPA: hypothetical protein VGM33_18055 [Baekduia sp.]|jgi:hypothetical protein